MSDLRVFWPPYSDFARHHEALRSSGLEGLAKDDRQRVILAAMLTARQRRV